MSLNTLGKFIEYASLINSPGLEMFLSDGNHTIFQIDVQIYTMMSILLSNDINNISFELIDKINFQPNTKLIRLINKWIKLEKEKGNSPKKLVIFGQAIFDDRYKMRLNLFNKICNKYQNLAFKTTKQCTMETF